MLEVDEDRRRIGLSIRKLLERPDYTGRPDDAPEPPRETPKRKKPRRGGLEW